MAQVEQILQDISRDHRAAADYHQSELVETSRDNGRSALSEAIKLLSRGQEKEALRLTKAAWFYARFARNILDAEATEHLLGDNFFFDLVQSRAELKSQIAKTMRELKTEIVSLAEQIPLYSENE